MTGPQRALMRLLDAAFGEESLGHDFVQNALRASRRTTLPGDPDGLLDFVRAYLMAPLAEELGPRMVSALLDDLTNELARERSPSSRQGAPSSTRMPIAATEPPKSSGVRLRASVLLCDGDRFQRASLARSLLATSFDVTVAETPLDVLATDGFIDVAILDMNIPDVAAVLGALRSKQPDIRVIAVTNDPASAEALIRAASVRHYRVVPRGMRSHELSVLIKRLAVA